jgi:adenylate cyclase class IV
MAANVEIKVRVASIAEVRRRAAVMAAGPATILRQVDTFFELHGGRLKLRCVEGADAQLIYYERPDQPGPKLSEYHVAPTNRPDELLKVLGTALGIRGVVSKRRELYLVGATRIHLDEVEGLGTFVELEVVLAPGQSEAEGQATADELMSSLGLPTDGLVSGAYIDLLGQADSHFGQRASME